MSIGTTIIPSLRQVIYGTYASFPSGGLSVGDLAWATDRKCLYRWSGSAWETIGISSRHGDYADIGDAADYPESSLYQADDIDRLYMVIVGAWKQISTEPGMPPWAAGDILIIAAATEQSTNSVSYVKLKEIHIASGGTIRVCFDIKGSVAEIATYYGRIYKNGAPHGTERSMTAISYETFTEDLVFEKGDLVQLYCKVSGGGFDCYCKNFELKADKAHLHMVELD